MNKDKQNQICRVMAENIILRTKARTLARENEKLRKLLKSANDGFSFIDKFFGCAGGEGHCNECPFNDNGLQGECALKWKHADEVMEVLNNEIKNK